MYRNNKKMKKITSIMSEIIYCIDMLVIESLADWLKNTTHLYSSTAHVCNHAACYSCFKYM